MQRLDCKACLADYLNTNPIEVLKSHFQRELSTGKRLIYYCLDKEYLQEHAASSFDGEEQYRTRLAHTLFKKFPELPDGIEGEALLANLCPSNPCRPLRNELSSESSSDDGSVDAAERTERMPLSLPQTSKQGLVESEITVPKEHGLNMVRTVP
mmetsp:Transcript_41395/g.79323  ORF Transcript_41395/g.79323 Transcript_41395/m.79323 type:complete len:154 (+) Transcript_41395:3-464(+)